MLKLTKNLPSCATDVAHEFPEAEKKDILKLFPKKTYLVTSSHLKQMLHKKKIL